MMIKNNNNNNNNNNNLTFYKKYIRVKTEVVQKFLKCSQRTAIDVCHRT
jgi:hypothetical protein